jgi:hypothetical protein
MEAHADRWLQVQALSSVTEKEDNKKNEHKLAHAQFHQESHSDSQLPAHTTLVHIDTGSGPEVPGGCGKSQHSS